LEAQEAYEKIEEAHQKHNKRAALIIILLAALLAISEMAGKHAQTASIAYNIEANDLGLLSGEDDSLDRAAHRYRKRAAAAAD